MGNRLTGKSTQTRNLLAENDLYQLFEFTFLRQQVIVIREVTTKTPVYAYLLAISQILAHDLYQRNSLPLY
jgi:hypothetical protein